MSDKNEQRSQAAIARLRDSTAETPLAQRLAWPIIFLCVSALAIWIGWIGFIASDDALYYYAANHWLTDPPFAGDTHWATRFPVVLSLAAMLTLAGRSFLAFDLTALFWYAMFVVMMGAFVRRLAGPRAGWIAATLTATLPVVTIGASVVNCDLPEVFFLVAGVWLLIEARGWPRAILAGTCFGLAVLCRETAILSLAGLGLPFLVGRPLPRKRLLIAALGAIAVLSAELAFQYLTTGDPFHRYFLAAHHDSHIDRAANLEGNLLVHPLIDPLLTLLINNEFGLLFWAGGAGLLLGGAWRGTTGIERTALLLIGAMALSAFAIIGLLQNTLVLNPRYFTIVAIAMILLVAIWLNRLRPRFAVAVIGIMVATNLLLLGLSNAHPHWPSEALAIATRDHPHERIASATALTKRAQLFLIFEDSDTVQADPSRRATLHFSATPPPNGAQIVTAYRSPPTRMGAIAQSLGLAGAIPAPLRKPVLAPNPTAYLTRPAH